MDMSPLEPTGFGITLVCAFIIGVERQWSGKPAGIRTSILICLSSFVFVSTAAYYQPDTGPVRILGQIVTGVGFLGAGVILAREGLVLGVTSAAVIWVLAAVGGLTGLGHYLAAMTISATTIGVLVGITFLEKIIHRFKRGVHRDPDDERFLGV